jgi:hypothetical protein
VPISASLGPVRAIPTSRNPTLVENQRERVGEVARCRRGGISDSIVFRTVGGAWGLHRARGKAAVAASPRIGRLWCRNCSPELGIRRSPWAEQGASRFDVSFRSLLSCSCSLCNVAFNSKFEWIWRVLARAGHGAAVGTRTPPCARHRRGGACAGVLWAVDSLRNGQD